MALYEDYLNQNNLYSRPSDMMSNVNDYLGANKASLPMNQDSLGSMMGKPMIGDDNEIGIGTGGGKEIKTPWFGGPGIGDDDDDRVGGGKEIKTPWFAEPIEQGPGANIYGQEKDLIGEFVGKLSSLNPGQQQLMLKFIGATGGDMKEGVSAGEWAKLFGVDKQYTNRFQGFPNLIDFEKEIANVFAGGEQAMSYEQKAAQQAQAAQGGAFQGGRGFSGFGRGRGMSNDLNRRSLMDTLAQRRSSIEESTANKYGQLIANLNNRINTGFGIAGDLLNMNVDAADDDRIDPETGDIITYGGDDGLINKDTKRATRRG